MCDPPTPTVERVLDAFEQDFNFKFEYIPIVIGGKVLEYYEIRRGIDVDFVLHPDDWKQLNCMTDARVYEPDQDGRIWIDFGGEIGGVDCFSTSPAGHTYDSLLQSALVFRQYALASLQHVFEMKQFVLQKGRSYSFCRRRCCDRSLDRAFSKARRDTRLIKRYWSQHGKPNVSRPFIVK